MHLFTTSLALSFLTSAVFAQQQRSPPNDFFWAYDQTSSNETLASCQTISVRWFQNAETSQIQLTPPFWLLAAPVGGVPTRSLLGSSGSGQATIGFRAGTQLALTVTDSAGHNGGVIALVSVIAGTTDCIQPVASPLTLGLNTTALPVCGSLGIQVGSGTPPYTITVLPAGVEAPLTNVSLEASNTYFAWPAAVNANSQMMVLAADSLGRFAPSSSIVSITGSNAGLPDCGGLVAYQGIGPPSSGGGEASLTGDPAATGTGGAASTNGSTGGQSQQSSGGGSNTGAIVGGVVGGIVGALILLAIAFLLLRRRRRSDAAKAKANSSPLTRPSLGDREPTDMAESQLAAPVTPFDLSSSNPSTPHNRSSHSGCLVPPVVAGSQGGRSQSEAGTTGHSLPDGAFTVANPDRPAPKGHTGPAPMPSKGGPSTSAEAEEDERPVHQHTDGGRIEVPPSYDALLRGPSVRR